MTTAIRRPMRNAASTTSTSTVKDWRGQAACSDEDPEIFFPVGAGIQAEALVRDAKAVCARCPVMDMCLQWALETGQESGVWGGLAEDERRKMRRAHNRARERERGGQSAADHIVATQLDEFQRMQDSGMTAMAIADALGTNVHTVYNVERFLGERVRDVNESDVEAFLSGRVRSLSSKEEELAAIIQGCARGMSYPAIDRARGVRKGATSQFVVRLRKRYAEAGRKFPDMQLHSPLKFTDEQVVELRETYAAGGVTDLQLAMQHGVDRKSISTILSGKSYRNAGGPIRAPRHGRPTEGSRVGFVQHQAGFAAAS